MDTNRALFITAAVVLALVLVWFGHRLRPRRRPLCHQPQPKRRQPHLSSRLNSLRGAGEEVFHLCG